MSFYILRQEDNWIGTLLTANNISSSDVLRYIVLQVRMPPPLLRLDWRWARRRRVTTSPTTSTWPVSARSRTWTGPSSPSTWSTGSTPWARRSSASYRVSDSIVVSKGFIFFLFPSGKLKFSLKENWKPNWERVGTLLSPTLSGVLVA